MQDINQDVTDVEFKEVPVEKTEETPAVTFDPVHYVTMALVEAGHPDPAAWTKDINPMAETGKTENDRIFFANRALRLYIAEQQDLGDNIQARMLLADGIGVDKWCSLIDTSVVPWLMGKYAKKDKAGEAEASTGYRGDPSEQGSEPESTDEAALQTPPWEVEPETDLSNPHSLTIPQGGYPTEPVDEVVDNSGTDDELRAAGFTTRTNPATGEVTALAPADARYEDEHGSGIPIDESNVGVAATGGEESDARPCSSEPN